ncbi:uncharacterized protein LOC115446679 [Manduca sexta]|uniref:Uncharacterized protein n=1 Tax=Manduca sexta TaxID=7130 RepID=A0A921ZBM5_MANSE|nr:uncharacterized protein LOC115446679 [Manduca sexta]KAG6455037.1 hypothetical protein O3G_MSEX009007 [Manduca sexta]
MQLTNMRLLAVFLGYLVAQVKTYPTQGWPMYPQMSREYTDDEYYYAPKIQYYYDAPAINVPEVHDQVPYPYFYDPYGHFTENEAPKRQEERLAALPIGQETWFESDTTPRWRTNDIDDVSAAFLDNLILTQMAQDAQRRRENARAAFPPVDYEERDVEDEDVRELKALAGKPLYHVPKTVPRYDEDDYASDDGFINWNSNKRSVTTAAPILSTDSTNTGQKEIVVPRPGQSFQNQGKHAKRNDFYETIAQLLENKSINTNTQGTDKERRIKKRFVAGDSDLVLELRGLKHRIAT